MTAPKAILVPKGRLDDAIAELRSAVARAEKAEAKVAQTLHDLESILGQAPTGTHAHITATAAIRWLK